MLSSKTENTGAGPAVWGRTVGLVWGLPSLSYLPRGTIKSKVGATGLEFREEVESGDTNFHVLYRELKLCIGM